jgi:hypothetical protein
MLKASSSTLNIAARIGLNETMYLFTDSKVALREAICRSSERFSPWELQVIQVKDKVVMKQAQRVSRRKHPDD